MVRPIYSSRTCNLRFPVLPDVDASIALMMPDHFELMYFENHHYDAFVSFTTGKVCTDHPILAGTHSVIELTS